MSFERPSRARADLTAFHNDVPNELASLPLKAVPVATDHFLLEDSADSFAKKRALLSSVLGGGSSDSGPTFHAADALTSITTGLKFRTRVSSVNDGKTLDEFKAFLDAAGAGGPAYAIRISNLTKAVNMLTADSTIAAGSRIGTAATVNPANNTVNTDDELEIEVIAQNTTPGQGLICTARFS